MEERSAAGNNIQHASGQQQQRESFDRRTNGLIVRSMGGAWCSQPHEYIRKHACMHAFMHIHRCSVVLSAGHQTQQHGSSETRPSAPSHSACASVRQRRCSVRTAASHIIRIYFRRCRPHGRGQFGSILGTLQCILHVSRLRIAVLTAPFHGACGILLRCCLVAFLCDSVQPDSDIVVSAAYDCTVRLWQATMRPACVSLPGRP